MTHTPATSAAEYETRTRDENKQRELHPADMGSIDCAAFILQSRDGQRVVWFSASDADRRGLAIALLRRKGHGPDEESIANYLLAMDERFGSDQATPSAAELTAACADRAAGHMAARYGKLAQRIEAGARLAWSSGVLLVASPSGALYHVGAAGCDCPNGTAGRSQCWHLLCRSLLLELLDEWAALADEQDLAGGVPPPDPPAARLISRLVAARAARIAA